MLIPGIDIDESPDRNMCLLTGTLFRIIYSQVIKCYCPKQLYYAYKYMVCHVIFHSLFSMWVIFLCLKNVFCNNWLYVYTSKGGLTESENQSDSMGEICGEVTVLSRAQL